MISGIFNRSCPIQYKYFLSVSVACFLEAKIVRFSKEKTIKPLEGQTQLPFAKQADCEGGFSVQNTINKSSNT